VRVLRVKPGFQLAPANLVTVDLDVANPIKSTACRARWRRPTAH